MKDTPLVIRLREAKAGIFAAVNAALEQQGLPCYLLEPILAEAHQQISAGAAREYEAAKRQAAEKTTEAGGDDNGP